MKPIFALTSGRSGTRFLSDVLRKNVANAYCCHEPYLRPWNPNGFGLPIYHHFVGNSAPIERLAERKARFIRGGRSEYYIETSHAFLKSFADAAVNVLPEMKLIHLVRDPLKTARSEANRQLEADRVRLPFRRYRCPDGRRLFRWSLTGDEPIFSHFRGTKLSLFQWYLVQWIEIENRAMSFLRRHGKETDCFTMESPRDLNSHARLMEMMEFFDLKPHSPQLSLEAGHNQTPGKKTSISDQEVKQARLVIEQLPANVLEIFEKEPYASLASCDILRSC